MDRRIAHGCVGAVRVHPFAQPAGQSGPGGARLGVVDPSRIDAGDHRNGRGFCYPARQPSLNGRGTHTRRRTHA